MTPSESEGLPTDLLFPERPRPDHASRPNGDDALDAHAGRQLGDATVGSRGYAHPLEQRAATLWYHDHRTDSTGPQSTRWALAPNVGIPPQAVSSRELLV